LCSGPPQLAHASGAAPWIRSQCPRAEQSGFKHWTVQPGRYCIDSSRFSEICQPAAGRELRAARLPRNPIQSLPNFRSESLGCAGLCAGRSSVSSGMYAISSVPVATTNRGTAPRVTRGISDAAGRPPLRRYCGLLAGLVSLFDAPWFSFAVNSSTFFCAASISCFLAPMSSSSAFSFAAPSLSEA